MGNAPPPIGPPGAAEPRARRWLRWGLVLAAGGAALAVALWPGAQEEQPRPAGTAVQRGAPALEVSAPPAVAPDRSGPVVGQVASDAGASWEVLAAALHEEMVPLGSRVVVEAIDRDRPWVCAGEAMGLAARLGGVPEPGAVVRWVWLTPGGDAELHPGPALQWRAPKAAGRYAVRFQVCKDLGGRRVGVLAERVIEIDVHSCAPGERPEHEPLRVIVTQTRQGAFLFQAISQGGDRSEEYTWSFGDGLTVTTAAPQVEHAYSIQGLGPQELRSFTVTVEARAPRGPPLRATAFAQVRGSPPGGEPPPVELEVSRWSAQPDGGWRSELVVRDEAADVTWDRLERVTRYWDGGVDVSTRPWSEVVRVEEGLERGGFRGYVLVSPSESTPGIKQILDFLYGRDPAGQEVVISWSPYKSEAPPAPPRPAEPLPGK